MESHQTPFDQLLECTTRFQELMKKFLAPQVVSYLTVCGYDRKSSFRNMDFSNHGSDSLNEIQTILCTNSDIFGADPESAQKIYGMFHKNPSRFIIMPGHRSQIIHFVQQLNVMGPEDIGYLTSSSRSKDQPFVEIESPAIEESQQPSASTFSRSYEQQLTTPKSLPDANSVLTDVRKQIHRYITNSQDPRVCQLIEGCHYEVSMEDISVTNTWDVYTTCLMCRSKLKVRVTGGKFCLSNFFRHIKGCVYKGSVTYRRGEPGAVQIISCAPSTDIQYFSNSNSASSNDEPGNIVELKYEMEASACHVIDEDSENIEIISSSVEGQRRGNKRIIDDISLDNETQ